MSHQRDITPVVHTDRTGPRLDAGGLLRGAIIIAAMLCGWVFSAERAAADCGSYVVILNPSPEAKANQQAMAMRHASNPQAPKPCNGPQCRARMPGPLPVAPPVTQSVGMEHHAMLAGDVTPGTTGYSFATVELIVPLSPGHLLTAEPPPRG